mmetsp:Transcript_2899/g.11754  ORF Transcript_2899/g.11754 Transcript_2899/m.11754 type:complete len:230 (-) Transcript_2899:5616-6305(-)
MPLEPRPHTSASGLGSAEGVAMLRVLYGTVKPRRVHAACIRKPLGKFGDLASRRYDREHCPRRGNSGPRGHGRIGCSSSSGSRLRRVARTSRCCFRGGREERSGAQATPVHPVRLAAGGLLHGSRRPLVRPHAVLCDPLQQRGTECAPTRSFPPAGSKLARPCQPEQGRDHLGLGRPGPGRHDRHHRPVCLQPAALRIHCLLAGTGVAGAPCRGVCHAGCCRLALSRVE